MADGKMTGIQEKGKVRRRQPYGRKTKDGISPELSSLALFPNLFLHS
jgi:hypothetical protein